MNGRCFLISVVAQLLKNVFSKPWSPPERKKKKIIVTDFKDSAIILQEYRPRLLQTGTDSIFKIRNSTLHLLRTC